MTVVWKFPVPATEEFQLMLPKGAEVLHVASQGDAQKLYLWARVDPKAKLIPRYFRRAGTGHPIGDDVGPHVSTFQMDGGRLVLHVFEVTA